MIWTIYFSDKHKVCYFDMEQFTLDKNVAL